MSAEADAVWGEQDENGVDLAQLRYNLTLSDAEKIEQHDRALRFTLKCMEAAERARVSRSAERP